MSIRQRGSRIVAVASDGALGVGLSNGRGIVWIDACDWPLISSRAWKLAVGPKTSYASSSRLGWMHRRIMGLKVGDPRRVDHRDRDGLNNRRGNLRFATMQQNAFNTVGVVSASSRFKGVVKERRKQYIYSTWRVTIKDSGKTIHLGHFATEEEAAMRYNVAAKARHGEFACLNQVEMG